MKYSVVIKPLAESDIRDAVLWYEQQRSGLGEKFMEAIEEKLKLIEENPDLFEIKYKGTHQAFLNRFPFAVHYIKDDERIIVVGVLHTSRDPQIWKSRK